MSAGRHHTPADANCVLKIDAIPPRITKQSIHYTKPADSRKIDSEPHLMPTAAACQQGNQVLSDIFSQMEHNHLGVFSRTILGDQKSLWERGDENVLPGKKFSKAHTLLNRILKRMSKKERCNGKMERTDRNGKEWKRVGW